MLQVSQHPVDQSSEPLQQVISTTESPSPLTTDQLKQQAGALLGDAQASAIHHRRFLNPSSPQLKKKIQPPRLTNTNQGVAYFSKQPLVSKVLNSSPELKVWIVERCVLELTFGLQGFSVPRLNLGALSKCDSDKTIQGVGYFSKQPLVSKALNSLPELKVWIAERCVLELTFGLQGSSVPRLNLGALSKCDNHKRDESPIANRIAALRSSTAANKALVAKHQATSDTVKPLKLVTGQRSGALAAAQTRISSSQQAPERDGKAPCTLHISQSAVTGLC